MQKAGRAATPAPAMSFAQVLWGHLAFCTAEEEEEEETSAATPRSVCGRVARRRVTTQRGRVLRVVSLVVGVAIMIMGQEEPRRLRLCMDKDTSA